MPLRLLPSEALKCVNADNGVVRSDDMPLVGVLCEVGELKSAEEETKWPERAKRELQDLLDSALKARSRPRGPGQTQASWR